MIKQIASVFEEKRVQDWSKIEQKISISMGKTFRLEKQAVIGGGDTNEAYQIDGILGKSEAANFFIKFNKKNNLEMFKAEAEGLQEIEKAQAIGVPHVIASGVENNQSYIILEKLSFRSGNAGSAKQLGQQLAKMHQHTAASFGWSRDNTIGSTEQLNTKTDDWVHFWREYRLGYQLSLAKQNGATQSLIKKGERLSKNLEALFINYEAKASLLHGDLWSGNYGYLKGGMPVIFDPAVYYGDRETDIAMTELFGGFPVDFYSSYNETWPLDNGYQQRKILYNLYHILNHYNLFGGG
jgi:protein-ribulosamine 3-kinase